MNWFNAVAVGLLEILANKFRSLLTMLGIILGVSSLVAMSALTKGMENGMKEALIAIGGLEKVRIEDQDIPVWQQHIRQKLAAAAEASAPGTPLPAPQGGSDVSSASSSWSAGT